MEAAYVQIGHDALRRDRHDLGGQRRCRGSGRRPRWDDADLGIGWDRRRFGVPLVFLCRPQDDRQLSGEEVTDRLRDLRGLIGVQPMPRIGDVQYLRGREKPRDLALMFGADIGAVCPGKEKHQPSETG